MKKVAVIPARGGSTRLKNTKYVSTTGVSIDEGAAIELNKMSNFQAPLNIRFTHSEDVMVKTCRLRIFDRNDIFKGGINPHHYCLPILKRYNDKISLINVATSGNSKFFLGTDNAPHTEKDKLSCGCAGIFNSPVAVQIITELFYKNNKLENLEKFISTNGCDFYNLPYNKVNKS